MKRLKNESARVFWRMGQPLLPEHFYTLEEVQEKERNLDRGSRSMPFVGLSILHWSAFQLREGLVSIDDLLLFLPSGIRLDVPGNAEAPPTYNLAEAGSIEVTLYLHLSSAPIKLGAERTGTAEEEGIERLVHRLELSSQPYTDTSAQSFELAHLRQTKEETWEVDKGFIPRCVCVTGNPFFDDIFESLQGSLKTARQVVDEDVQENYLSKENQLSAKQALEHIHELSFFLNDVQKGGDLNPHPYELYAAARRFYIALCMYREVSPDESLIYLHSELGPCFSKLLAAIDQRVRPSHDERPYEVFVEEDSVQVCALTDGVRAAREVYWLVERPTLSDSLDLGGVKLASKARVRLVHTLALKGVPFEKVESAPFRHGFSAHMEIYILKPGKEWDYVVSEGKIAFVPTDQLKSVRTYLYWRKES